MEETGIVQPQVADTPSPANEPPASPWRKRITITSVLITILAAAVVLPPLVNIGRYQRQVTTLVSRSLGRPVELSSVELRLLPRPGFVLTDLSVAEDPAFGFEPVLSAHTVVASIGILSLWQGKLSIARVSVDEASLNLVQSAEGRWNLEALMMGAQPELTQGSAAVSAKRMTRNFPYLEATNSRVNLKRGLEKTPFSILNTNLSLWQDDPGLWRIRLRGQPVRTDMEMSWEDTGDIRLEASLRNAPQLRDMPLQLQMEWRDAHLGQLSRLLLGSDAGWRGDLTADIEVHGTAESASTKARLRAIGVRREEFAPETPIDFDSNCTFLYQHSISAIHNLNCVTDVGSGQLLLKAELPGKKIDASTDPEVRLEFQRVPFQAALDLLRTVRGGFAPGITATGVANGTLIYKKTPQMNVAPRTSKSPRSKHRPVKQGSKPTTDQAPVPVSNLQGSLSIESVTLKGGQLAEPLTLPTMTWTPSSGAGIETSFTVAPVTIQNGSTARSQQAKSDASASKSSASPLLTTGNLGSSTPASSESGSPQESNNVQSVHVSLQVRPSGYTASINGSAPTASLRTLSYAFGLGHLDELDNLAGGSADLDLYAQGSWLKNLDEPDQNLEQPTPSVQRTHPSRSTRFTEAVAEEQPPGSLRDQVSGTLLLHRLEWTPPFLPRPVELPLTSVAVRDATVVLNSRFSYGAANAPPEETLQGTAIILASLTCHESACPPSVELHFGSLDATQAQSALLGKPEEKSIFDSFVGRLQARLHSPTKSESALWPQMPIQIQAESLVLGQTILKNLSLKVRIVTGDGLNIESWSASTLGGTANGIGSFSWTNGSPDYEFTGKFSGLDPTTVGNLLGSRFKGDTRKSNSTISGSGKIKLNGLDWKQLASSASGEVEFDWPSGTIEISALKPIHFSRWSGTLSIQNGQAHFEKNMLLTSNRSQADGQVVEGSIALGVGDKPGIAKLTVSPARYSHPQ